MYQNERFYQAWLKYKWANFHIDHLRGEWEGFLQTDFCQIVVKDYPNGSQFLQIVSVKPIPPQIILLIGDIIHNFRCVLDYVISEILGWKDTRLTFPMGEEREELVNSFRTNTEIVGGRSVKKGRNAAIEMAVPGIGKFIVDTIGSYKGGNKFLWPLGKLDGRDKHRLLIPVLVAQTINDICVVDANNNRIIERVGGIVGIGGKFTMFGFPAGGVKIKSYGKPTADIFFNEVGIIEGQSVLPTLVQISQAVLETVRGIDEFLDSIGWKPPT